MRGRRRSRGYRAAVREVCVLREPSFGVGSKPDDWRAIWRRCAQRSARLQRRCVNAGGDIRRELRERCQILRTRLRAGFRRGWIVSAIERGAEEHAAVERRDVGAVGDGVRRRCALAPLDLAARERDRQKARRRELLERGAASEDDSVGFQQARGRQARAGSSLAGAARAWCTGASR